MTPTLVIDNGPKPRPRPSNVKPARIDPARAELLAYLAQVKAETRRKWTIDIAILLTVFYLLGCISGILLVIK